MCGDSTEDSELVFRYLCCFFPLFYSTSTFSSPSEVRQNNICEDALEWNILVTHLV